MTTTEIITKLEELAIEVSFLEDTICQMEAKGDIAEKVLQFAQNNAKEAQFCIDDAIQYISYIEHAQLPF